MSRSTRKPFTYYIKTNNKEMAFYKSMRARKERRVAKYLIHIGVYPVGEVNPWDAWDSPGDSNKKYAPAMRDNFFESVEAKEEFIIKERRK